MRSLIHYVASGEGMFSAQGRLWAVGPGQGFGEIGLLRRVPRTATVRAATDLRLHALTGERFLPVVTGFPPSSREAATSVATMLDRFRPDGSSTTTT